MEKHDPCVVITGTEWREPSFFWRWLQSAAEAETFWKTLLQDRAFKYLVRLVIVWRMPDFGLAGIKFMTRIKEEPSFVLSLYSDLGEEFAMMTRMGFFVNSGQVYNMAIPETLTAGKVKMSVLDLATTEDRRMILRPQSITAAALRPEATAICNKMRALNQFSVAVEGAGRV